jgi:hypothetical protein
MCDKRTGLKRWISAVLLSLITISSLQSCSPRPYRLQYIAKTDTDIVADAHLQGINTLMIELLAKLYKRNPDQLAKSNKFSIDQRISQIFDRPGALRFHEIGRKEGAEALNLCFDDQFSGDRVFALMAGLVGMIRKAYNEKTEFYVTDSLDQQKLYNSARNIEILVWRLGNKRTPEGRPYILTNGVENGIRNLSFERLFGKMIAVQDMLARIMEDRSNRAINQVAITVAKSAFLPVGF